MPSSHQGTSICVVFRSGWLYGFVDRRWLLFRSTHPCRPPCEHDRSCNSVATLSCGLDRWRRSACPSPAARRRRHVNPKTTRLGYSFQWFRLRPVCETWQHSVPTDASLPIKSAKDTAAPLLDVNRYTTFRNAAARDRAALLTALRSSSTRPSPLVAATGEDLKVRRFQAVPPSDPQLKTTGGGQGQENGGHVHRLSQQSGTQPIQDL